MSEASINPTLTRTQVRCAMALARCQPSEDSPLHDLLQEPTPAPTDQDWTKLWEIGWVKDRSEPRITAEAKQAIQSLCQPRTIASTLLGTRDSLFQARFYSTGRFADGGLVSLVASPDGNEFGFVLDQSAATLADILMAQLLVGDLDVAASLRTELDEAAFIAFLSFIDWRLTSILRARLDRTPAPDPSFRPDDLWETLVEGQLADDLGWAVTSFRLLLPFVEYQLDRDKILEALVRLEKLRLIHPARDGRHMPADPLLELADGLQPILSFAGLSIETQENGGNVHLDHLAFVRGWAATLMVQPMVGADGRPILLIDNLDGVELGELLFTLGLPDQRIVGAKRERVPAADTLLVASDATSPSGWHLVAAGHPFPLGERTTLGRDQENDICLQDELISRYHAVVERVETEFQITDLKSSNGTFVNGQRIQKPTVLQPGDTVRLGNAKMEVASKPIAAERVCSSCGEPGKPGRAFCTRCGNPLPAEGRAQ